MGYVKSAYIQKSTSTAEMREIYHANFGMFGEPHLTIKRKYTCFSTSIMQILNTTFNFNQ